MSNPYSSGQPETTDTPEAVQKAVPQPALRWWPAILLVLMMVLVRYLPKVVESPGIGLFMFAFMGPAALGALILVWWLAASRASWREKVIGFVAVLGLCVVASVLLDPSMQGMGVMLFVIPAGCGLFAIATSLFANRPAVRLTAGIIGACIGFGAWDFVRSPGVSGKFDSFFVWRWSKTSEQKYLETLSRTNKSGSSKPETKSESDKETAAPAITLESSQSPTFRGKSMDGKFTGTTLTEDWSQNAPRKVWLKPIGPGWSSFTIANQRLFTQEQRGESEAVVCLDAGTGEEIWAHEYESRFWEPLAGAGPRATPTIANEGLFALGGKGILTCINASTGKEVWHRDLQKDASREPPMWGFSSSPLVTDGIVVVHAGGKDKAGVLAYDAKTGESRWSAPSGDHSYSSPQLATISGVTGILMETNAGLQFLKVADGSSIWQYDWPSETYRTLQPMVLGDSVLIASSLGGGSRRITAKLEGEAWSITEEWTSKDMKPDFNDFVEHNGFVYGFDGNIFGCIDLQTGKRKWKKGRYGNGQVLLLSDSGQLLVTSEKGEIVLLKADPEKMVELAKFPAIEGKTWNHPLLVGNRIYLRNDEQAACYELPTK